MATHSPLTSFDALYCEEEEEIESSLSKELYEITKNSSPSLPPPHPLLHLFLLDQDLLWQDEELISLFSKETETTTLTQSSDAALSLARTVAVHWILKVTAHYGFSALTSILAVNDLNRFLFGLIYHDDKPCMVQLAAVACLSLATKVEETHVPLLLDFQLHPSTTPCYAKLKLKNFPSQTVILPLCSAPTKDSSPPKISAAAGGFHIDPPTLKRLSGKHVVRERGKTGGRRKPERDKKLRKRN